MGQAGIRNPGPDGWVAPLRSSDPVREETGGEPATTNNRMELQAAISALKAMPGIRITNDVASLRLLRS